MYRIDTPTSVNTLAAPGPAGAPGYFSNGNPTTGQPATIPGAEWFNMVQEELMGILGAAGLDPNKDNRGQIAAAIVALIANGGAELLWGGIGGSLANQLDLQAALDGKSPTGHTHSYNVADISGLGAALDPGKSLASNGWCKTSNGLILQWGTYSSYISGEVLTPTISFPIAFPNAVFVVVATDLNPTGNAFQDSGGQLYSKTTTGFRLQLNVDDGSGKSWAGTNYIAIGY